MARDPFKTALLEYIKSADATYYGKCGELREAVRGWLSYIPHTFPHYTRHTVEHSDEIICELSLLIFFDDDPSRASIKLSAVEAYILVASAYLHDAGMVVSDEEKLGILNSEDWKAWTKVGGGAKRSGEIEALRKDSRIADEGIRNFLADIEVRFLIAEFVRKNHHEAAGRILTQHQESLGRFAFDDPVLLKTITDVCVAHGLKRHELLDSERYPEHRTIRGEAVNVRFLAILLRLGDLLDLSNDRACALLLNAACPLPPDSLAHWSQYRCITHRSTTPGKLEISAKCHTQEEHTTLQDWCQWLIDEAGNAAAVMTHAARHSSWRPPVARLEGESATISIQPSANATYIPSRWTFELDHEAVFQRLIQDVDRSPLAFLRELIQNSLDAMRCKMFLDLRAQGQPEPEYPTQVPAHVRDSYKLHISVEHRSLRNPLSGETETRQTLTVDDCGIGMDKDVILKYLLQVGRSYYTTDEFRRQFRFAPTSRFGVGFLSVFNASNHVVVETFKPTSRSADGPIRLVLKGPSNFLLTEKGSRKVSGTCIELLLQKNFAPGSITQWVEKLCRRVEFPIVIDEMGKCSTVGAEKPEQFLHESVDVTEANAKFAVRAHPISEPGIEGEIYLLARIKDGVESWSAWRWARYSYEKKHPLASAPQVPDHLLCFHGIDCGRPPLKIWHSAFTVRLDVRKSSIEPPLSRRLHEHGEEQSSELERTLERNLAAMVKKHLESCPLARGKEGWIYIQKLVEAFPSLGLWRTVPGAIRAHFVTGPQLLSLSKVCEYPIIRTASLWEDLGIGRHFAGTERKRQPPPRVTRACFQSQKSFV